MYPFANIWLVGHSLGGSLASLLGSTFGLPAVAFEAPGERLAAHRLHLPLPPPNYPPGLPRVPITHVYHNADPIPQGACTGAASLCAQAGYALETRCHLGKTIVYDTVGKLGWHVDVRKHVIQEMILNVLDIEGSWPDGVNGGERDVPIAQEEVDCVVRRPFFIRRYMSPSRYSRIVSNGSLATLRGAPDNRFVGFSGVWHL